MNDELRKKLEEVMASADPELVAKFGNPLDENDPKTWLPSKRAENGISLEDQVKYLGLDLESSALFSGRLMEMVMSLQNQLAILQKWVAEKMADEFTENVKNNPEKAVEQLKKLMNLTGDQAPIGSWGPLDDNPNSPVRYAGSTQGIKPDQMVDTPQGPIRADQIPGYSSDPNWKPSPDWVDANCMCPVHVESRKNQFGINPFGNDDPPNGMYL